MAFDFVLDSLDSVEDEKVKALYKEDSGKFKLDLDAYAEYVKAPVVAKNKDYQKRLEKVKPFADKFKDVTDDDWTKYQEWKESQNDDDGDDDDKGKDGKKGDQVDVKKLVKEELKKAEAAHLAALAEKDKAIEAEKVKFDAYRFEQSLTTEALEGGVIGARLKKFMSAILSEKIFGFHEGKLVVLDDDGEPASEAPTERMKKLANSDEWKFFFEAKEQGGGSGRPKGKTGDGGKELKRSKMSPKEKSDYIKEHGNEAFFKLPL